MLDMTTAKTLIRPHMPVVCSENGQFATVDHLEGRDQIKLTKDKSGLHHYIPLDWVTAVDDKVHLDRPESQVMKEWKTESPTPAAPDAAAIQGAASINAAPSKPGGSKPYVQGAQISAPQPAKAKAKDGDDQDPGPGKRSFAKDAEKPTKATD